VVGKRDFLEALIPFPYDCSRCQQSGRPSGKRGHIEANLRSETILYGYPVLSVGFNEQELHYFPYLLPF
jgi:hypothetical protein